MALDRSLPTAGEATVPLHDRAAASDPSWLVRLVEWYQRAVDGRPSPCRFTPSCSAYAHEALLVHGTWRGLWLTVRRLARCRPFGPSGFDPVPEISPCSTVPPREGPLNP